MTNDNAKWRLLIDVMARLRGENGCPWDLEQDHHSLKKYLLEEAYEVLDAIDAADDAALCDELGDVLLQVVFHARLAEERGAFAIDDVLDAVNSKMIRRHPHVFGSDTADDAKAVLHSWELIKAEEKRGKTNAGKPARIMQLNDNLPALMLAQKAQDKAARVGFDWPDASGARAKVDEELQELAAAGSAEQRRDEFGDLLFSVVNMARFAGIDAEDALRHAAHKFCRRFDYVERRVQEQGGAWSNYDLAALDRFWNEAKEDEAHEIG
ncbi:MAG: nucleoside triphosphate pyrophosphohydrolase [Bacillota bacterium]|nr:nucleoside triphosphate pyrophosphohydrolase [Bacillota bacterium]